MKKPILLLALASWVGLLAAPECVAQDASQSGPLHQGPYVSAMGTYLMPEQGGFKNTPTGTLIAGFRRDWYAIEFGGTLAHISAEGGTGFVQYGGSINGLVFPFASADHHFLRNLYGAVEFGGLQNRGYPSSTGPQKFLTITYAAGVGNLLPFHFGRYEFALRTEALYRYENRTASVNDPNGDIPVPGYFKDVLINVGLQLPLGLRPREVPTPTEAPVSVVPSDQPAEAPAAAPDAGAGTATPVPESAPANPAAPPSDSAAPPGNQPAPPKSDSSDLDFLKDDNSQGPKK